MPVINGVYLKDFTALPSAVVDANIIPIAISGNQIAYRTTVGGIVTDARVTSKLLTGLSVTGTAILATDTILQAFGKVQNQLNGKVTSVGLTMPAAFSVANSPITSAGTLAVTAAGVASQYIRGDGALADFPTTGGGGSSVSYYLNGSVSQGTIGGNAYYEMNKTPVIGTGTDFTIAANGYIAQFITDANDPASLLIPGGNWNVEMYFSASSNGGTPSFYVEVYKYNGTTFTLLGTSSATPEGITNGTAIDLYYTSVGIPETVLTITDRLAIRVYVTHSGRTITLHTEDNHLSEIVTTFSNGLTALNGLTKQAQYFATGTTGTDFTISSSVDTHTFNIPSASATARGLITTGTQTIAGAKTLTGALVGTTANFAGQLTLGSTITNGTYTYTLPSATGTIALTSDIHSAVTLSAIGSTPNANAATLTGQVLNLQPASASFGGVITTGTQTFAGDKTFTGNINASPTSGNAIQAYTTSSIAISVQSTTGDGVQSSSTTGAAIKGTASGTSGYGVVGQASGTSGSGGYFTGSGSSTYGVFAEATGTSTTALYGTANSASYPVQRLVQSGAGSIALFDNTSGTVATITNGGGLTLSALLSGTTGRFTGQLRLDSTITNGTYTYTLPSATGTLALTSALSGYLPLSGGTLTGALSGTSATFSGDLTIDTNTLFVDSTNNRVGIGTATPSYPLHLKNATFSQLYIEGGSAADLILYNSGGSANIRTMVYRQGTGGTAKFFSANDDGTINKDNILVLNNSTGNILVNSTTANTYSGVAPKLEVYGTSVSSSDADGGNFAILGTTNAADSGGSITLGGSATSFYATWGRIRAPKDNATSGNYSGGLAFDTRVSGGNFSERMRITSGGNFDYGGINNIAASPSTVYKQAFYGGLSMMWRGAQDSYINLNHTYTTTGTNIATYGTSDGIGRISMVGGEYTFYAYNGSVTAGTAYALSETLLLNKAGVLKVTNLGSGTVTATSGVLSAVSDMNLKIEDGFIDNALEKVLNLKPRYFNWKEESGLPTDIRQLGFYAQEVNAALGEEAANTPKNENDKWGIYDRGIVAFLVKAIQEQQAQIEELKLLIK